MAARWERVRTILSVVLNRARAAQPQVTESSALRSRQGKKQVVSPAGAITAAMRL